MVNATEYSVLHVDDDVAFGDLTADMLSEQEAQFTVETAASASEGLDRLAANGFDCIVSDYEMPGQNGIEFLETVREEYPDLPFILYTGKGSEAVASDAIAAGVTDYLQKESGTSQYTVLANRIRNAVEKRRQQERAQATRDRLRQIIDMLPQLVFVKDETGEFLLANEATANAYETTVSNLVGATDADFVNSEAEIKQFRADDQTVIESGEPKHILEESLTTTDGEARLLETTKIPYNPVEADGDAVLSISMDITERKERDQELQMVRKRFKQFADNVKDAFFLLPTDYSETEYVNTAVEQIYGITPEEAYNDPMAWLRHVHPDDEDELLADMEAQQDGTTEWPIKQEFRVDHPDRGVRWVQARLDLVTGENGDSSWLAGVTTDITDLKERERELEETTEELEQLATKHEIQYRTIFEEAPVMAVLTRSEDGRPIIEDCNSQFVETLGYDADRIIGSELAEFYTPESAEKMQSGGYGRSLNGQFTREKRDLVAIDGEVIDGLLHAVPRSTADGEVIGTVAMYINITERESLKRANARLEEFANVISHDLRNPLNVAAGRLELAAEECDSAHLDNVEQALDRMETLIDDLLLLAREGEEVTDAQSVSLATIIDECWETVETNQAVLMNNTDQGVQADRSRLKQVFENLFRNAVEHGRADVTVTVGELNDGFYVEDDGPGIPCDERDDIFEAGYSSSSDGTGFGLSIVEQTVTAHGWQIRVTDGGDGGARFEITDVEFVVP